MTKSKGWQRLDPLVIWLDAVIATLGFAGLAWYFLFSGNLRSALIGVAIFVGGFLFFVVADIIRCATTRFHISDERVELRYGLLWKVQRSIPRDRIRSVDITANPLYRIFSLATIKLGTGQHSGNVEKGELTLDALSLQRAEELQRLLLQRPREATRNDQVTMATFQFKWIRFAILGLSGFALIGLGVGALGQILELVNADFEAIWRHAAEVVGQYSLGAAFVMIFAAFVGIFIVGIILSALVYLENWSGYRLSRMTNGTLHLTRGLLFRRSVSIEERRIRGVEYSEPLQIRWAGGALLRVIVSGFGQKEDDMSQEASIIMPAAPQAEIDRLATDLLKAPSIRLARFQLRKHPKAALYRIIIRRVGAVALIIGLLLTTNVFIHWLTWVWVVAALICGLIMLTSFDAYHSLGHDIRGDYLIARRGSLLRRTAVLQRSGIIGWKFRQSPFQRRVDLITLIATTAAGRGAYKVFDVDSGEGISMARVAIPKLLDAFVEQPKDTS